MSRTDATTPTTTAADPTSIEIEWSAIVTPHAGAGGFADVANGTAGTARLVANIEFGEGDDATLHLHMEGPEGEQTILEAHPLRVRRAKAGGWTSLDLHDDDDRVAAVSWAEGSPTVYVRSTLPALAGLAPGSLEPPQLRLGE